MYRGSISLRVTPVPVSKRKEVCKIPSGLVVHVVCVAVVFELVPNLDAERIRAVVHWTESIQPQLGDGMRWLKMLKQGNQRRHRCVIIRVFSGKAVENVPRQPQIERARPFKEADVL